MGLAASQARLLSLTARIHDVEFEAQSLQYAKMRLALQEDDVTKNYLEALDAETLSIKNSSGNPIAASFNNICGLGSIDNNFGRNHYLFRDGSDNLIVPTDVYNGYMDFINNENGSDPYAFAMYMLSGGEGFNIEDFNDTVSECFSNADSQSKLNSLYKQLDKILSELYTYTTEYAESYPNGGTPSDEDLDKFKDSMKSDIIKHNYEKSLYDLLANFVPNGKTLNSDGNAVVTSVDDIDADSSTKKKIEECLNDILSLQKESKHILYKNYGESIYKDTVGPNANFDQNEFNYYLRWAKLIEQEGGYDASRECLNSCIPADNAYGNDIENNPQFLNEMVMSGRITIDIVYDCSNGEISDRKPTSAATDNYITMEKTANIDSTAAKKAEAEYNHKLKEINQIDKKYDLSLNRLETERNALTTEYESVKKVISDNVERSFGIFS